MIYCGKTSQGCEQCRTHRIKCDRKTPDCSQCVRVSKECPGYRDQFAILFRDESSKVMQRAHSQWGVERISSSPSSGKPTNDMQASRK
ncbi:Fungal Zn(2)-Cys(6) binuclear cluster domain [Geosmithia morbida]|uniref:Fungal Zn(2)-Cys(6) binuclear cluster domain n=1 Tax=Geosmithia morbida TaxID=1094350 RepID=A0A9P4YWW3_9HYPO|nr:Fungal Zn(2)-Cys(6) binuclear cluster domain [Geosmithia morbida]KAF4123292.1 Fungal Zn(2)-Cys(6) binuclear cluster domain [Geosmithia morbida]